MAENITTVPSLPDADFDTNPSDSLLYLVQGTGSDRDRKATLSDTFDGMLPRKIDQDDYSGHDVGFSFNESRGGMVVTADIRNGKVTTDKLANGSVNGWKLDETSAFSGKSFHGTESLGAPTVTATTAVKTPTVEGTTQGTTSSYLLVNSAMTVNGDADLKSNVNLGGTTMKVSLDDMKVDINGDAEVSGTLSATGAVTVGGKLTVRNAVSVSGALGVSAKASLSGGADVSDLKITGSVQFPSGNGIIPTEVHDYDASSGETLSNYYGTSRNLFVLIVNADSTSHDMKYTSQEAQGAMTRIKTIPVAGAGLFYIDGNGNAAPVS